MLKTAWTYDTGEGGRIETNPLIVGRTLYAFTASQKVIALDALTGTLKWRFDSGIKGTQPARGALYMADGKIGAIFAGIMSYLYKLDAGSGKPITSFGEDGRIDLRKNLRGDYLTNSIALTTPGVVYKDVIIVGGRKSRIESGASWRHPCIRCEYGNSEVGLPHNSASGRGRVRDLEQRLLPKERGCKQLGRHGDR
jgi:glucose dehydrogenase